MPSIEFDLSSYFSSAHSGWITYLYRSVYALACLGTMSVTASPFVISVQVTDPSGQALSNTAIYAEPAAPLPAAPAKKTPLIEIEQKNRMFLPLVTLIQTGTSISFPNNDTVRHHVYSFSSAKSFELKLYAGIPSNPVIFDKSGTVILGCNIHDKMVAYIHIVDTPYYAKTDASGKATLEGLPAGTYTLKAWHPNVPASDPLFQQSLNVTKSFPLPISIKLNQKPLPASTPSSLDYIGQGCEAQPCKPSATKLFHAALFYSSLL